MVGDDATMSDTLTELYTQALRLRAAYAAAGIGTIHLDHALFQVRCAIDASRVGVMYTTGDTVELSPPALPWEKVIEEV